MTTEEAIKILELEYSIRKWIMDCDERDDGLSYYDAIELAISALRAKREDENSDTLKTTYETPESCPRCMEHLSKDWSFCPECGRPTNWSKKDPLTLDELREMDGNPIWVEDLDNPERACYWLCYWDREKHFTLMSKHLLGYLLGDYGKTWLAFRRKPKGD